MIQEKIQLILDNKEIDNKIDALLELDRDIRDLGLNHTKTQKLQSRRDSKKIYQAINKLDPATGAILLKTIDKY